MSERANIPVWPETAAMRAATPKRTAEERMLMLMMLLGDDRWMLAGDDQGKRMVQWGEGEQSGYVLEPRVCGRSSGGLGEQKG
jgi:hypothetical protein